MCVGWWWWSGILGTLCHYRCHSRCHSRCHCRCHCRCRTLLLAPLPLAPLPLPPLPLLLPLLPPLLTPPLPPLAAPQVSVPAFEVRALKGMAPWEPPPRLRLGGGGDGGGGETSDDDDDEEDEAAREAAEVAAAAAGAKGAKAEQLVAFARVFSGACSLDSTSTATTTTTTTFTTTFSYLLFAHSDARTKFCCANHPAWSLLGTQRAHLGLGGGSGWSRHASRIGLWGDRGERRRRGRGR